MTVLLEAALQTVDGALPVGQAGLRAAVSYAYPACRPVVGASCERRAEYRAAPRPEKLSEALLQAAWRRAGGRRLRVAARDGRSYRVLYPGRPGGGRGPDFLDAVLERDDGAVLTGDIEVHVRPSGWVEHGHGKDARYNGVVFHVAATGAGPGATSLAMVSVPLLVLAASGERGDILPDDV
jgi:Protein of unknown function (DUF2851)